MRGRRSIDCTGEDRRTVRFVFYLDLWALRFPDRETRKNALASLKRANSYVSTAEVSEEDQILLLITCVGDDDERLVVAAVRIKQ